MSFRFRPGSTALGRLPELPTRGSRDAPKRRHLVSLTPLSSAALADIRRGNEFLAAVLDVLLKQQDAVVDGWR